MNSKIIQGNNVDVLKTFPDNTFDSIVTDPPYGIDFLGKEWDANTGALETYQECLRVLKPGGHILAFSAARTYHHLAVTIEQAGFEIRDQIVWIYSSGFPKSQDVGRSIQRSLGVKETKKQKGYNGFGSENGTAFTQDWDRGPEKNPEVVCTDPEAKQWSGWGTALKPAHEPIVVARKPIKLSIARNCQQWGVGALNIDATRVPWGEDDDPEAYIAWMKKYPASTGSKAVFNNAHADAKGVDYVRDQDADINLDRDVDNRMAGRFPSNVIGEIEGYQKYFYCPKVSRAERHAGFELPPPLFGNVSGAYDPETGERFAAVFDKKHDPLAHIPTDASGKYDRTNDPGNANERIERKGAATTRDLLLLVDGKYVAEDGTLIDADTPGSQPGKMVWLPGVGKIFAHGLKHEVEKILKATGREAEIPKSQGNNHPTVKPIELMKYLIKLVTPKGGHVLDPFNGSGSTGCAAVELDYAYTGIELDPAYVSIAEKRIAAWYTHTHSTTFNQVFEIED